MHPSEMMKRLFGVRNDSAVRTLFVMLISSIAVGVRLGEAKDLRNNSISTNPESIHNSVRTKAGDFGKEIFKRIDGFYDNETETRGSLIYSNYFNDSEQNPDKSIIENAKYFNTNDEYLNISLKTNASIRGRSDESVTQPMAAEQRCNPNEVQHEDACIKVTSIQVMVTVPEDLETDCNRFVFTNRMIYFAMNRYPSLMVRSIRIRKDTIGAMALAVVDNQLSDPYMTGMTERFHIWSQLFFENPNSVRFLICPNGDKRLCAHDNRPSLIIKHSLVKPVTNCVTLPCADQFVSNASDVQSDESHHVAWNESLELIDVGIFYTSTQDQLNLDAAITTQRTDALLNGTTDPRVTNAFVQRKLPVMNTNKNEVSNTNDHTMDNQLLHGDIGAPIITEVLDLGRCCYCQQLRRSIRQLQHEQRRCQEIDLSMYFETPGPAFISDVHNLNSVHEIIHSMSTTNQYLYCMDFITHPPHSHILPECYKTCRKEIRHFKKYGVPLHPALAWDFNHFIFTHPFTSPHSSTKYDYETATNLIPNVRIPNVLPSGQAINDNQSPESASTATRVSLDITWLGCLLILSLRSIFKFVSPVV